ncbi:hypothetical protein GJ744_004361 [Endocarpon pusillum]|uniref:F-box domain-containing protein n=1 Tax=Endocarpon pusillum TaxID=364733 RepID=A0A8H7AVQ9_9EURO|nr:hypothetical protein GJ744_004361 [Endocarpon pusillum]
MKATPKGGRKRKRAPSLVKKRPKFLRFPPAMLATRDPTRRITRSTKKIDDHNKESMLLNMPTEVILQISEKLDVLDRAALALSCKDLAAKLNAHNHLDWDELWTYPWIHPDECNSDVLLKFFRERLTSGWIPSTLWYCEYCGKYGPRNDTKCWLNRLKKEFDGKHRGMSRFIEEYCLTYGVECLPDDEISSHAPLIKFKDEDPGQIYLVGACPRCQVFFQYWGNF